MQVVILGGTGFLGPHFAEAALARGHAVAVFSRGQTQARLPPGVEELHGDRDGDLSALAGRSFDAVVDIAAYRPGWVRSLGKALHGRVGHYTFISTVGVYDMASIPVAAPIGEDGSLSVYDGDEDPYAPGGPGEHYGALKVLAEREAADVQFPGATLVLRPCYIVGPGDPVGALTYWAERTSRGGEVLAAGDPSKPVHVVDVRDMAAFAIDMAERGGTGTFNVVGPDEELTWGSLLGSLTGLSAADVSATWVPLSWLAEQGVTESFSALRFWGDGVPSGGRRIMNDHGRANGFAPRPLASTVADVRTNERILGVHGARTLDESMALERELLDRWSFESSRR
jgi:2'-hydroxyisoflavone reductase